MTPDSHDLQYAADIAGREGADRVRELSVLGCLMRGGRVAEARQFVGPGDFKSPDTREVAEAFFESDDSCDRVQILTDVALAKWPNLMADIGLTHGHASGVSGYARALAKQRLRERLVKQFTEALGDLQTGDPEEVAAKLGIQGESLAKPSMTLGDAVKIAIDDAKKSANASAQGQPIGAITGLASLDRRLGSFRTGDLMAVVADTSLGKSAIALQFTRKWAKQGFTVGYITLEMPEGDVGRRLLSVEGQINGTELRKGNADAIRRAEAVAPALEQLGYKIDSSCDTPDAIESRIYRWHAEGVRYVVLDHFLCVQFNQRDVYGEQSRLMSRLRRLTLKLDVAILVVTQYRKDSSGDARTIADIWGSAAIAQYSTHILAIHPDNTGDDMRRLEFFKIRDGVKGVIASRFQFNGRTQTMTEVNGTIDQDDNIHQQKDYDL